MSDNNQRIQANQLAADTGAIVRTMMLASAEYEFLRLTAIRSVMAGGMSTGAICSAVDYLAAVDTSRCARQRSGAPRAWRTSRWKAWRLS